jgi:hypothetical protein
MKAALLAFSLCIFSISAHAESNVETFLRDYDAASYPAKEYMAGHLSSIEDGMSWANVALTEDRKEFPLYCVPRSLVLTGEQLIDVLRRHLETNPYAAKSPFPLVLLVALQEVFPCAPKSK